jgi:2-haloacid dehalogenase
MGNYWSARAPLLAEQHETTGGQMTRIIAFDVNETLLDLSVLDEVFASVFGDASLKGQWFAQMLQLSFVGGLTGEYVDFSAAQTAAFLMLAERADVPVTSDDAARVTDKMNTLPAHPEVRSSLEFLRDTPLTVVALVNSLQRVGEAQLTHAGIRDCFDAVISADEVQRLKPAREAYELVASAYETEVADVRLVAAHSWDISGALAAGCKAAFVRRPGMVLSPLGRQPGIIATDIADVVAQIIDVDLP